MSRIRTLKPECWHDEALGRLGAWERLLFIGLITMADDEGRLRALPSSIAGHVFPYDNMPAKRIRAWLQKLAGERLLHLYSHGGVEYAALTSWRSHQKISHSTPSKLPAPPRSESGANRETGRSRS